MKRTIILLVAVVAVATACSSPTTSSSAPESEAASVAASVAPTVTPTPEASASEGTGSTSELAELLPDDLNGVARTDIPGLDAIIGPALAAQGVDASDVDFVFASYGEGTDALVVQAIRVPGLGQPQLEQLAQLMAGAGGEADVETTSIGGKTVLRMTGADMPAVAYMYFADGAMFTIVGESEDQATQLLAELP